MTSFAPSSLQYETQYYARVRHTGALAGESAWSPTIAFKTKEMPLPTVEVQEFQPPNAAAYNRIGPMDMDSSGTTLVVGNGLAPSTYGGAAYIYTRSGSTWSLTATLLPSTGNSGLLFGSSVSITDDGNTVAIGAKGLSSGSNPYGGFYIFKRSGGVWTESQKIFGHSRATNSHHVKLSGDGEIIAIGAPDSKDYVNSVLKNRVGFLHFHYKSPTTGNFFASPTLITNPEKIENGYFGAVMDFTPDASILVVSGYQSNVSAHALGRVSTFLKSGNSYTLSQVISNPLLNSDDYFGASLRISPLGDYLAVGHTLSNGDGISGSGCVHIYKRVNNAWVYSRQIISPIPMHNGVFGTVDFCKNGTVLLVGMPQKGSYSPIGTNLYGYVFAFERQGEEWVHIKTILPGINEHQQSFGDELRINESGSVLVVNSSARNFNGLVSSGSFRSFV